MGLCERFVNWDRAAHGQLVDLVHAVVAFCNDLQKGVGFCFAFNER